MDRTPPTNNTTPAGAASTPTAASAAADSLAPGFLARQVLTDEEMPIFTAFLAQCLADYRVNQSVDRLQLEWVGIYTVKMQQQLLLGHHELVKLYDGMLQAHLRELKATKRLREGEKGSERQQSPCEWASELVARYQKAKAELAAQDAQEARDGQGA